jgi:hypothetical protein
LRGVCEADGVDVLKIIVIDSKFFKINPPARKLAFPLCQRGIKGDFFLIHHQKFTNVFFAAILDM